MLEAGESVQVSQHLQQKGPRAGRMSGAGSDNHFFLHPNRFLSGLCLPKGRKIKWMCESSSGLCPTCPFLHSATLSKCMQWPWTLSSPIHPSIRPSLRPSHQEIFIELCITCCLRLLRYNSEQDMGLALMGPTGFWRGERLIR